MPRPNPEVERLRDQVAKLTQQRDDYKKQAMRASGELADWKDAFDRTLSRFDALVAREQEGKAAGD